MPTLHVIPSVSIAPIKSAIFCATVSHSIPSTAAIIPSIIPSVQTLNVSASKSKSNVLKKLFTPAAIELPKFFQSNVVPKESKKCNTVFKQPAIVFPNSVNNSGEIKPLRKSAKPLPNLSAALYTGFQFIFFNCLVICFPTYFPIPLKSPLLKASMILSAVFCALESTSLNAFSQTLR